MSLAINNVIGVIVMTGSVLGGGLGGGSVLGAATVAVLPSTGILPQTGSGMLMIVSIAAFVAIVSSFLITRFLQFTR